MKRNFEEPRTSPTNIGDALPPLPEPRKISFRGQIIPENYQLFEADPGSPSASVLLEALKELSRNQSDSDPNNFYLLYLAMPLTEEQLAKGELPELNAQGQKTKIQDLLSDGNYVLFLKVTPDPIVWEIWILDHRIPISDKSEILIGRSDPEKRIIVDLDLSPYLNENTLKISRKQAWLKKNSDHWTICLDEDAHSPVYLNGSEPLKPGINYDILSDTRIGFGGQPNRCYLEVDLRIKKQQTYSKRL